MGEKIPNYTLNAYYWGLISAWNGDLRQRESTSFFFLCRVAFSSKCKHASTMIKFPFFRASRSVKP